MSRSIVHFLLSLMLLVSQQLALAHGLSHADQLRRQAAIMDGGTHGQQRQDLQGDSDTPALHEFCAECAADAQLDVALPLPDHAVPAARSAAAMVAARCGDGVQPQPVRPFQPRAPPRAN